jgi:hypothetical protein
MDWLLDGAGRLIGVDHALVSFTCIRNRPAHTTWNRRASSRTLLTY